MTEAVTLLLRKFHRRFGKYPDVAQFDDGMEFHNVGVKSLLKSYDINYFSTNSVRKAAIVERFNRTLKTMMWKYFYEEETHKWVNILDDLVGNYNNTKHSSILMRPSDVNKTNEDQVWVTLYGYGLAELPVLKFRISDTVRIYKYKSFFSKGYEANFTDEIFVINKVYRGDPNMYELRDNDDEPIIGKFYEEELSPVSERDNTHKVEKILKRKKEMVLVKWEGYDNNHNSWIREKDIR